MKRRIILSIAVVISVGILISALSISGMNNQIKASSIISKLTPEQRIEKSRHDLKEMESNPNEVNQVLVSFNELTAKEFIKTITDNDIRIIKIYHGYVAENNTFRGAYTLKSNESIDSALDNYESEIIGILQNDIKVYQDKLKEVEEIESKTNGLTNEKALEEQKSYNALKKLLADTEQELNDIRSKGLMFYGVRAIGNNSKSIKLYEKLNIRSIEILKDADEKANPIFPNGGV